MHAPPANLLDLMPTRAERFETAADGRVTVLVPRLRNPLLVRVLKRLAAKPMRVRLDELGSFVWVQCDGVTTVHTIADRVRERFGGEAEAVMLRTGRFVNTLVKGDLVTLAGPPRAS